MKKVYIVLTYTGTVPAHLVKFWTKREYSHVSISLDESLTKMYSFARLGDYNVFNAGFLHEHINKGVFRRFKKTEAFIGYIEVTNRQYKRIEKDIEEMENQKEKYRFNYLGFFGVMLKKKRKKENTYYCAEFVKKLLDDAYIKNDLPNIIIPSDFQKINNLKCVYKGKLRDYVA